MKEIDDEISGLATRSCQAAEPWSVQKANSDELSTSTSGELPSDYEPTLREARSKPQGYDRDKNSDASWVLYDTFDNYGNPR